MVVLIPPWNGALLGLAVLLCGLPALYASPMYPGNADKLGSMFNLARDRLPELERDPHGWSRYAGSPNEPLRPPPSPTDFGVPQASSDAFEYHPELVDSQNSPGAWTDYHLAGHSSLNWIHPPDQTVDYGNGDRFSIGTSEARMAHHGTQHRIGASYLLAPSDQAGPSQLPSSSSPLYQPSDLAAIGQLDERNFAHHTQPGATSVQSQWDHDSNAPERGQGWLDLVGGPTGTSPYEIHPPTSHRSSSTSALSRPSVQPIPAGFPTGWQGSAHDSRGGPSGTHALIDEPSHGGTRASLVDAHLLQMRARRTYRRSKRSRQVGPNVVQQGPPTASTSSAGPSLQQPQQGLPRRRSGRPKLTETNSDPVSLARIHTKKERLAEAKKGVRQGRDRADREALLKYGYQSYEAFLAYLNTLSEDRIGQLAERVFSGDGMVSQTMVSYASSAGAFNHWKSPVVYSTHSGVQYD